jgi:hypothetical protein
MSTPSNAEVINALSMSVNFSFVDRSCFGALFCGSGNSSQSTNVAKGVGNTAFGSSTLSSLIETSKNNTAFGYRSQLSTEGDSNTSFGKESMLFNTLGNENTAFGANTFDSLTLGDQNIAFGFNAGKNLILGNGNIFLGNNTGVSQGNINNSVVIGNDAQSTSDNQFVVGSENCNTGKVISEQLSSTKTWNVVINGVEHKILLA